MESSIMGETTQSKKIRCEVYTRVCGFYRPVSCTNKGKRAEIQERKMYDYENFLNGGTK